MSQHAPSGAAVGWTMFAAIMMSVLGIWWAIIGFAGILKDDVFVLTPNYVFELDVTTWGWIHMLLGVVLFLSGIGIRSGNVLARTVGVIAAGVAAVANFLWLPYQPVWSTIIIAVCIGVIWALTAHGRDVNALGD